MPADHLPLSMLGEVVTACLMIQLCYSIRTCVPKYLHMVLTICPPAALCVLCFSLWGSEVHTHTLVCWSLWAGGAGGGGGNSLCETRCVQQPPSRADTCVVHTGQWAPSHRVGAPAEMGD